MASSEEQRPAEEPPTWAIELATAELYDTVDQGLIMDRARQIARDTGTLHDERHTEYDDPDRGGEG